jgi:hypothetical protein
VERLTVPTERAGAAGSTEANRVYRYEVADANRPAIVGREIADLARDFVAVR